MCRDDDGGRRMGFGVALAGVSCCLLDPEEGRFYFGKSATDCCSISGN